MDGVHAWLYVSLPMTFSVGCLVRVATGQVPVKIRADDSRLPCTTVNPNDVLGWSRELSLAGQTCDVAMTCRDAKFRRTLKRVQPPPVYVGVFAFKNVRRWRTANGTRSFASFHGKKVICAFGASIAVSSATA
jgi:hypothetical protein